MREIKASMAYVLVASSEVGHSVLMLLLGFEGMSSLQLKRLVGGA